MNTFATAKMASGSSVPCSTLLGPCFMTQAEMPEHLANYEAICLDSRAYGSQTEGLDADSQTPANMGLHFAHVIRLSVPCPPPRQWPSILAITATVHQVTEYRPLCQLHLLDGSCCRSRYTKEQCSKQSFSFGQALPLCIFQKVLCRFVRVIHRNEA